MWLLVGLGNPGADYARNRHNVGFVAVEKIIDRHKFGAPRKRFQGIANEGAIGGEKILALRPQTYMNESGRSVGEAMRFFKIEITDVFVFYDEIDLSFGKVRVKTGGGAAGHNGIRSIAAHIGDAFHRVRIGVGHPGHAARVHGHVLSDFGADEREALAPIIDALAANADLLLAGDFPGLMNKLALLLKPPREPGAAKPSED